MILLKLILTFVIIETSQGKLLPIGIGKHQKVLNLIKNFVVELNEKDLSTHDVAVLSLTLKIENQGLVDDISAIIPKENPVFRPPWEHEAFSHKTRVSSLIIIIVDVIDLNLLGRWTSIEHSDYYTSSAKFILVIIEVEDIRLKTLENFFLKKKILNVAIIAIFKRDLKLLTFDPFLNRDFSQNATTLTDLFPEKLKDLNGYAFKAVASPDRKTKFANGKVKSPAMKFLEIVAKKKNAKIILTPILKDIKVQLELAVKLGNVDICLNPRNPSQHLKMKQSVSMFEVDGYCALIPNPEAHNHQYFLFKPFRGYVWCCFLMTVVVAGIIWHLLNKTSNEETDSWSYYFFASFASFLRQPLPFRRIRPIQRLILQATIFTTLLLSESYDFMLVAWITNFYYGTHWTTINEMIEGNYVYKVNPLFFTRLQASGYFKVIQENIVGYVYNLNLDFKNLSSSNVVIIDKCSFISAVAEERAIHDFYYQLEERFSTFYLTLLIPLPSFFLESFRENSLRIFESGIVQTWTETKTILARKLIKESEYYRNEEYYLKYEELRLTFHFVIVGLIISTIVFIFELKIAFLMKSKTIQKILKRFRIV